MNIAKLKGILAEKGVSREYIARKLGVNPCTLYRKLAAGGKTFTVGECQQLVQCIPLTNEEAIEIFLD